MPDKVVIVTPPAIYESKGPSYAFVSVDPEVVSHFIKTFEHDNDEFTVYIVDHKNCSNQVIRDYVHDIYPKVDKIIVDYSRCPLRQVNLTAMYTDKELQVFNYQNIEEQEEYIKKTNKFIMENINGR